MAFGKITKADLIEAGLDPDKIKEFQDKGVTKDDLAALKTELATSVTDLIKAQFTELEGKLTTARGGNNGRSDSGSNNGDNQGGNNGGDGRNLTEDENAEFIADPTKFVNNKVAKLGAAAAMEFKKMSAQLAYDNAKGTMAGFKNLEIAKEIDDEWKKYTPEVMVRNNTDPVALLKSVHDMVMGRHMHEILADRDKKDGKYNFVSAGGDTGSGNNAGNSSGNNNNKRTLSPDEEKQARKFGMSNEDWLKSIEESETENAQRLAAIGGR